MANAQKIIQAAAGAAGGESVYVDDVFSTYLYEGNGANQTISNGIELGSSNAGGSAEFASGEYLERSSDFTSNSDSKTFTLSVWVFYEGNDITLYRFGSDNNRINLSSNQLEVVLYNSSSQKVIDNNIAHSFSNYEGSWVHVLLSLDVNSGSGQLYVNDSAVSWTVSISNNSAINFTEGNHRINGPSSGFHFSGACKLSSYYLDYTYRNLGTTSNRRIFIDSNGYAVSGLESNNPILYLPLSPDYAITKNLGTGGDFSTATGSITTKFGPFNDTSLGKGGLVWTRWRSGYYTSRDHNLFDTERGTTAYLNTNNTSAEKTSYPNAITYNSNGFTLNNQFPSNMSFGGETFVSWTFRKQAGFFDVVTYTGTGSNQTISHNLGSVAGCIIVRSLSGDNWYVWHRSLPTGALDSSTGHKRLILNSTAAEESRNGINTVTSTSFDVLGTDGETNSNSTNYVAYVFAHDDQSFGDDSDESIIKCGSYSGNGLTTGNEITLGFEPQWLMVKRTDSTGYWAMMDIMRGITDSSNNYLQADSSAAEQATGSAVTPTATGFNILTDTSPLNNSSGTYIYIAIRRPMKTPEAGTDVFAMDTYGGSSTLPRYVSNFPVDLGIEKSTGTGNWFWVPRLTERSSNSNSTAADVSSTNWVFDFQDGWGPPNSTAVTTLYSWMFKRATGFFDVVAYEGNGSPSNTVRRDLKHNLGVTPELAILKRRDSTSEWQVGVNGTSLYLNLTNSSAGTYTHSSYFNATDFDVEGWVTEANNNVSGSDYIVYLFATLAGVSKVGSYTGTGSAIDVDCGFSAGARFVLVKRTDSASDWFVYDTARGINASADPYLNINTNGVQDSANDEIDPLSSGFTIPSGSNVNTSGGTYIFLAIA